MSNKIKVGEKKTKVLTTAFIEIEDCPFPMTPVKRYRLARRGMPFSGLNLPFSSVYAPIPVVYTIIANNFLLSKFSKHNNSDVFGEGQEERKIYRVDQLDNLNEICDDESA